MAVPTSYTYETFADYLKDEVLRASSDSLGWGDTQPAIPAVTQKLVVLVAATASAETVQIQQSTMVLPAGTSLTFSNGAVRTLNESLELGETHLKLNSGGTQVAFAPGDTYTRTVKAAIERVRNPLYTSVADEALEVLGLDSISDVNSTNIKFFRMAGRVVVLKRVMQSAAADYSYTVAGNTGHQRVQVYAHLTRMYQIENARFNRMLQALISVDESSSIPGVVESASKKVKVRF